MENQMVITIDDDYESGVFKGEIYRVISNYVEDEFHWLTLVDDKKQVWFEALIDNFISIDEYENV